MNKETKSKYLLIRITPEEKDRFFSVARQNGFDKLAQFVLWCVRKQVVSMSK